MARVISLETPNQQISWTRNTLAVFAGSLLIALFANVSLPLPFTPVPITMQVHVCLLLGALLGSKRGALAVLAYLFQGAVGFPVFAMGKAGFLHLLGPTGGYLLGYVVAAYVTGYLLEKAQEKTPRKAVLAMAAGNLVVYAMGIPQLSLYIGLKSALIVGTLPFILGDVLKLILARQGFQFCREIFGFERDL
jgi:biotin transport system substrate-specific component